MTTTPTSALVEEATVADGMSARIRDLVCIVENYDPDSEDEDRDDRCPECKTPLGAPEEPGMEPTPFCNCCAHAVVEELAEAVQGLRQVIRQAETARDAALQQSAAWEIQAQDMRDRLVKAEAERDAQHAEVLRLTGERDAARAEVQTLLWIKSASVKLLDTLQGIRWMEPHEPDDERVIAATRAWVEAAGLTMYAELLKTIEELRALGFGLGCMLTNAQWRERDAAERAQRGLKLMQSCLQDEERKVSELTATRDLLLTENAQLQQMLSRPDPVVHETPVDGVVPCCGQKLHDLKDGARVNEGPLVNCDRMRLLSRVGELGSANLLLTAENERLRAQVATLELLRRGGK